MDFFKRNLIIIVAIVVLLLAVLAGFFVFSGIFFKFFGVSPTAPSPADSLPSVGPDLENFTASSSAEPAIPPEILKNFSAPDSKTEATPIPGDILKNFSAPSQ